MKKIFIILFTIVIVVILFNTSSEYIIPEESIRFRVIPNSNDSEDILIKQKITYEISNIIRDFNTSDINLTRKSILSNLDNISSKAKEISKYNTINVNYGLNYFPEKTYKDVKYESGYYESLVLTIGEGKGNNYWCVLYPPLCLIDEENEQIKYKSKVMELVKKYF